MLKCKICGHESKHRLIEHLMKTHKYNIEEYKSKYGPVISDDYRKKVSNNSKNNWKRDNYRNKTNLARNTSWTPEKRKRQSIIIKKTYDDGHINWNSGLTKETDIRVKSIGDNNRECLTGRTKDTHEYLKKHSELMKSLWKSGKISSKMTMLNKDWMDGEEYEIWRSKISNTISKKIKSGEINCISGHFKTGYHNGIFYMSGLELEAMEFFDSDKTVASWKRNFDVVPYKDINGNWRRYLPDFCVELIDGKMVVIETKGYDRDKINTKQKTIYARKKYKYYFVCKSVKEIEQKIYEIINNKIHK